MMLLRQANIREIPPTYEPLCKQLLLNLAINGELKDKVAGSEAIKQANEINKEFDEFLITVARN